MLIRSVLFALGLACAVPASAATPPADASHDGRHDFDFETGAWTTNVRVLRNPLSGAAPDWAEYQGTSIIRPLMDGRSNLVELSVAGTRGKIEGVALRLYSPQAHQWSLNYANMGDGLLTAPVFGSFDDKGRGAFYGRDMLGARDPGALNHHSDFAGRGAFRAGLFGGRRRELGSELDRGRYQKADSSLNLYPEMAP